MADKKYSMQELGPVIAETVNIGNSIKLTVTGISMFPLLRNEIDSVVLEKKKIKKYDIALYTRENGAYILHRIVKMHKDTVDCIGDNERKIEKGVPKSNIIACVTAIERGNLKIKTTNPLYRIYSFIWGSFIGMRRIFFKIALKVRNVFYRRKK